MTCFWGKPKWNNPTLMGKLPVKRLEPSHQFINCRNLYVDLLLIREGRARGKKTTFTGANSEYKKLHESVINQDTINYFSNFTAIRHFIPSRSPNIGGLWKDGIKGTKYHLK